MKPTLTPGRLYAKLTSEFRQVCCANCARCVLPVPTRIERGAAGANWSLGTLPNDCQACATEIAEIVRRNQAEYDLLDPVSSPDAPRHPPRHQGPLH